MATLADSNSSLVLDSSQDAASLMEIFSLMEKKSNLDNIRDLQIRHYTTATATDELVEKMQLIASKLKNVQSLSYTCTFYGPLPPLPIRALTEFLRIRGRALSHLVVNGNASITGCLEDFTWFFYHLKNCGTLLGFKMDSPRVRTDRNECVRNWFAEQLLLTLTTGTSTVKAANFYCLRLRKFYWKFRLKFDCPRDEHDREVHSYQPTPECMRAISGANSEIDSLTLNYVSNLSEWLDDFIPNLAANNGSLKRLTIRLHDLGPRQRTSILNTLATNTVIEFLEMSVRGMPDLDCIETLPHLLRQNHTLKTMILYIMESDDISDDGTLTAGLTVIRGLKQNRAIEALTIGAYRGADFIDNAFFASSCRVEAELALTLRSNTVLQDFTGNISRDSSSHDKNLEVDFWLELNTLGRKALVENPSDKALWTNKLIDLKASPHLTFYIIMSNLTLFLPSLLDKVCAAPPGNSLAL